MEYRTVREMAQKWNVSERLVQKYCARGRIQGARKFGVSWGIPEDARKPGDLRKPEKKGELPVCGNPEHRKSGPSGQGLMPLMNTPFQPGRCRACIRSIPEGACRDIAMAEYYYFSGQPEKAAQKAAVYLAGKDPDIRLSACLIFAYANLSIGKIHLARQALAEMRAAMGKEEDISARTQSAEAFISATAAVLLHLPLPEGLPPAHEFLPALPPGLRAFALYVQAHRLYLEEKYEKSLGMVEATFAMGAQAYPIAAIYLHLVAVMDHMSLRDTENAKKHLLAAWELARPDDLIEGLGEHHGLLGGMLEAVIKPEWPEDFKRIIEITYRFSAGWRKVHNPDTGEDVADNLTTTEFSAAMLAARGWTNQEIGTHMNISPNTVKKHLSTVMQKLGISRRQDLKQYMLR